MRYRFEVLSLQVFAEGKIRKRGELFEGQLEDLNESNPHKRNKFLCDNGFIKVIAEIKQKPEPSNLMVSVKKSTRKRGRKKKKR